MNLSQILFIFFIILCAGVWFLAWYTVGYIQGIKESKRKIKQRLKKKNSNGGPTL